MPHSQDSDSEDDDYIPNVDPELSESSDDERASKRPRMSPTPQPEKDPVEVKKARDALWASFQESLTSTPTQSTAPAKETVKVEKQFKFAGETIIKVVEVLVDSADARQWPLWHAPEQQESAPKEESAVPAEPSETSSTPSGLPQSTAIKPPLRRPGPRKPKVALAALPNPSSKPKKLSTLDKSAMDWKAHVEASGDAGLKDELEANRRGGGYMEKVEFLNRVEERREGVLEAHRSSKRRKLP